MSLPTFDLCQVRFKSFSSKETETGNYISPVSNRVFGILDFPYGKFGIGDFKAKFGRDSGLKECAGGGIPNITLGITVPVLREISGRDYGIELEDPYWGLSGDIVGISTNLALLMKRQLTDSSN